MLDVFYPILKRLREEASLACEEAKKNDELADQPVNWFRLDCFSAELYFSDEKESGFRVRISKVDPQCPKFKKFIADYLKDKGFERVEVHTEW